MRALICFATVCVLAVIGVFASPNPEENTSAEASIRGLEYAWNQAELHHDTAAVGVLLAPDFVRVDDRGKLVNRSAYIAEIGGHSTESEQIVNEDLLIHAYGDAAVAVSTYHVKGVRRGKPFLVRGRFIDTWVRLQGKWQCVANQETVVQ